MASGGSGGGSDTVVVINNTVLRDWESRIPTMTPKDLIDVCKNLFVFTANITASSALLDRVKISLANVISVDDKNYAILLAVEETIKSQYALWSKKNGSVNNIVNIMFNINPKPSATLSSSSETPPPVTPTPPVDIDERLECLNKKYASYCVENNKLLRQIYMLETALLPSVDDKDHAETWRKTLDEMQRKLNCVMKQAHCAYSAALYDLQYQQSCMEHADPDHFNEALMLNFDHNLNPIMNAHRMKKPRDHQKIMIHLMPLLRANNYHYRDGFLYKELKNKEGSNMYYWKREISFSQFITNVCADNQELFMLMTSEVANKKRIEKNLTQDDTKFVPHVKKDRYVFSYNNGIYYTKTNKFHAYTEGTVDPIPTACRHFDIDFDSAWIGDRQNNPIVEDNVGGDSDEESKQRLVAPAGMNYGTWKNIKTPLFDSLLKTQKFDKHKDLVKWIYALLGRLLYRINEFDHWEVMCFLLGFAGTGKSTILDIVMAFFEFEDVTAVGNITEIVFGLESFIGKFMAVATDINSKFTMDSCYWKSITTGERLKINRKNNLAITAKLIASWIMAGNAMPAWKEDAGSIARRLALLRFIVSVKKVDTTIKTKILRQELGKLLVKMNRAYRECVIEVGTKAVHEVWPRYFNESVKKMQLQFSPLGNFLHSKTVVLDPQLEKFDAKDVPNKVDLYCREDLFKAAYQKYCKDPNNNINDSQPWDKDMYNQIFALHNIVVSKAKPSQKLSYPRCYGDDSHRTPTSIDNVSVVWGVDLTTDMMRGEIAKYAS